MTTDVATEKIQKMADLIKKLQAMAADTSSPHEAALAAERIEAVLLKYNLDLATVEGLTAEQRQDTYGKDDFVLGRSMDQRAWLLNLLNTLARHNFCSVISYGGQLRASIVGRSHNVEAVKYLYDYLRGQLTRMSIPAWAAAKATSATSDYVWKQSFYKGAVTEIDKRLQEAEKGAGAEITALVVTSQGELQQAVQQFFPRLKHARQSKRGFDLGAYQAGAKAGREVPMNHGVTAGTTGRARAVRGKK